MPNETGGEAEADNGVVEATSAEGEPMPAPEAEPEPTPIDTTSKVAILGYHRFSDTPNISRRLLPTTIHIGKFRTQMQLLVDNEIPVISMGDFLAWRRGERNLPRSLSSSRLMTDGNRLTIWPYPFSRNSVFPSPFTSTPRFSTAAARH